MRPAAFFTGIGGMVVVVGLLLAGEARLGGASDGDDVAPLEQTPGAAAEAPAAQVTPDMPDARAEALAQAAAPTPPSNPLADAPALAKPSEAPAAKPAETKSIDLPRPVVDSAGLLSFAKRQLQLADIIPTPENQMCGSGDGQWPCGMVAKTQLRLFLRGRTVSCDLAAAEWKGTTTAACRLGTQDIATWLVENGWAKAAAGTPLADASAKAKADKLGLYGEDPRGRAPATTDLPSPEPDPDPLQ